MKPPLLLCKSSIFPRAVQQVTYGAVLASVASSQPEEAVELLEETFGDGFGGERTTSS